MLVAVTFLCAKYQHKYVITAAITALGYLINTGITSLNMQVVPGVIHPRIFASDLTVRNDYNDSQALSVDGFLTTTWNPSFRERESGNSILNTIMRNLLVMTEEVPIWCNKSDDYSYPFKQVAASYGFPARTWQQYALSTALEPSALVTLPMNAATSELPTDIELPMNKSIATNLAAYALLVSNSFLGWWGEDDVAWGHNWYLFYKNRTDSFAMADHLNLTEHFSGETSFLANVHDVIVDYYSKATNASTTDNLAKLEFSRVDLSETVVFDALTIEIPTQIIGKQAGNSSDFYKSLNAVLCNHDACLMNDLGEFTGDAASTTVYPRVQALAICFNQAGGEDLVVDFNYCRANEVFQACEQRSNTSMIIVSVGKRLEGDVFESRPENTSSGIPIAGQVKNARMVYSLTVGRLSWTLEDLSGVYSAECLVEGGCYGIQFPLENAGNTSTADVLVSSARGTPLNLLSPINLNELFFQPSVSISQWKVLVRRRAGSRDPTSSDCSATQFQNYRYIF
ncbi:hypothetical protein PF010_g3560 [Phytophthora fragariae]|uniref:Uncharacterized protein n=1 Tax=Phytophthora fragariae TaxID=53985 RepID=A0A6G0LTX5_9STRA|nr:hypothetical protein PF010_g3560 [Phytophthora fragariae]